jgi:hypothetical protein
MGTRGEIFKYVAERFVSTEIEEIADYCEFDVRQVSSWIAGDVEPNHATVQRLLMYAFTPQFRVITEFAEFDPNGLVRPQLRQILEGHHDTAGLYAFYDSMANLIYIGKATKLLQEVYDAIRRPVHLSFPKGVKARPDQRKELVRYVSAYEVEESAHMDYPKHVESLILRISKPPLNKNIGSLEQAWSDPEDEAT